MADNGGFDAVKKPGQGGGYTDPGTAQANYNAYNVSKPGSMPPPQYAQQQPVHTGLQVNPGDAYKPGPAGAGFGPGGGADGAAYPHGGFPEAEANPYIDPSSPAVDGQPLYPPEAVQTNRYLSRFVKMGWKDVWASAIFMALVLMTIIWGVVNMITYKRVDDGVVGPAHHKTPLEEFMDSIGVGWFTLILIATCVIAVVVACISLSLITCFPKQLIYIANVFTALLMLASAVVAFISGVVVGGILLLICCALQLLWIWLMRRRIPFSAALLQASSKVLSKYKAVFVFNVLMVIVYYVFMVFWGSCVLPPIDRYSAGTGKGVDGFVIALFVLIFLWAAQVVPNVMHVTACGLIATWYFAGLDNMPPNPTLASFKRATTTSFGSICFGSLLVALIQFLRYLVEASQQDGEQNFLQCVLICILNCLDSMVQYFNNYAFVHVAVYGCGYIEAAKRTFMLCKQCFFAAYFNDCLVGPTLDMLSFAMSALLGALVGLICQSWVVGILAFMLAVVVHSLFFTAVNSAVTTIFVCFAEVPEALRQSDPALYSAIHAADGNGTHNNAAPL